MTPSDAAVFAVLRQYNPWWSGARFPELPRWRREVSREVRSWAKHPQLCTALELKRPTVSSFLDIMEATHLLYRLRPFGYGKQVLRGRLELDLEEPAGEEP